MKTTATKYLVTPQQLSAFCKLIKETAHNESKNAGFILLPAGCPEYIATVGPKYARITRIDQFGGQSAHAFVDMTTGDILKPDGWKRPAKGIRGSVLNGRADLALYPIQHPYRGSIRTAR